MTYYFGFEPSETLKNQMASMRSAAAAKDKNLYEPRDIVVKQLANELIDILLTQLVNTLPEGDQKKTMLKVTDIVQSTTTKLLGQILGKEKVEHVIPNVEFFENKTANTDANGVERLGFEMQPALYEKMHGLFSSAVETGSSDAKALNDVFDEFVDAVIQHFLTDFSNTLNLGFVKRKLLPIADSALKKGVKMGTKQLFPNLSEEDKSDLCQKYLNVMFEA